MNDTALHEVTCGYACDECVPNVWYEMVGPTQCGARSTKQPKFYRVFSHCRPRSEIRDPASCAHAKAHRLRDVFVPRFWDPEGSTDIRFDAYRGCVIAHGKTRSVARICFGDVPLRYTIASQSLAAILGMGSVLFLARHSAVPRMSWHRRSNFHRGAELAVMRAYVGKRVLLAVNVFRCSEVVTNVWLPMATMWVLKANAVVLAWFLTHLLPNVLIKGPDALRNPALLAIDVQRPLIGLDLCWSYAIGQFLLSMIRSVGFVGISLALAHLVGIISGTRTMVNEGAFYDLLLQSGWEPALTAGAVLTSVVGAVTCFVMKVAFLCPCFQIRLGNSERAFAEVVAKVPKICEIAERSVESGEEGKVEDVKRVITFSGAQVQSGAGIVWLIVPAVVHCLSYPYSVVCFILSSHAVMAAVISMGMWISFTTAVRTGLFFSMFETVKQSLTTGIATRRLLILKDLDKGIMGVPALMTQIYGLPLAVHPQAINCLLTAILMFSSTKAMVDFVVEHVDLHLETHWSDNESGTAESDDDDALSIVSSLADS